MRGAANRYELGQALNQTKNYSFKNRHRLTVLCEKQKASDTSEPRDYLSTRALLDVHVWTSSTSWRVTMPTMRPYSSTSNAGEVLRYFTAASTLMSSFTTGKARSITWETGDCISSRLSSSFAISRPSRKLPTDLPSSSTGS